MCVCVSVVRTATVTAVIISKERRIAFVKIKIKTSKTAKPPQPTHFPIIKIP